MASVGRAVPTWGATVRGTHGTPEAGTAYVQYVGAPGQAALRLWYARCAGGWCAQPVRTVRRPQGVRVSAVAHRRYVEVPGVWEGGQVGDLQLGCGAEGVEGAARAAALRAAAEEVGRAGGWWLRRRWRWQERRELPGIALSLGAGEALGLVGERVRTRTRGAGR